MTVPAGVSSASESSSDSALSLVSQGLALYHQGDPDQSLSPLNKSLSIDPYSEKAWMTKGYVFSAMKRFDKAVATYSQVLRLHPSDGSATARKGDALMGAGKYQDAVASYDRAIAMNPGRSDIFANRTAAKQLACGVIRANITAAAEPITAAELNSSKSLPAVTSPGTSLPTTNPPVSQVPGATKATATHPVLLATLPVAGALLIVFKRR